METRTAGPGSVKLFFTFIYILIFPALILILEGDWFWIEGWIFNIWFVALCATVIIYLLIHDPALLMERYKQPGAAYCIVVSGPVRVESHQIRCNRA